MNITTTKKHSMRRKGRTASSSLLSLFVVFLYNFAIVVMVMSKIPQVESFQHSVAESSSRLSLLSSTRHGMPNNSVSLASSLSSSPSSPTTKENSSSCISSLKKPNNNHDGITKTQRQPQQHLCELCDKTFESRNAMFRHIRTVHSSKDDDDSTFEQETMTRHSISLHFGYLSDCIRAGEIVLQSFHDSLLQRIQEQQKQQSDDKNNKSNNDNNANLLEIISTSQTSIAKARSQCLGQDDDCPAAEDILFVNFRVQKGVWNDHDDEDDDDQSQTTISATQKSLLSSMVKDIAKRATDIRQDVTVHGMRELLQQQQQKSQVLHAEHACTQEIFHFLLPIHWLPGDQQAILEWYRRDRNPHETNVSTPSSLRHFKDLLRSVESSRSKKVTASRRFGALKHKTKRPWHCYADPALQGEASPNTEVVWRIIDRARWIGFVEMKRDERSEPEIDSESDTSLFLVTEFCGDAFLKQQIRRIMGTLVAIAHGWLPDAFLEQTINPNILIETPLAPAGYLYRATSRFHAYEIYHEGRQFWDLDDVYRVVDEDKNAETEQSSRRDPVDWIQQRLMQAGFICNHETTTEADDDDAWLVELRDVVAPRIRAQLEDMNIVVKETATTKTADLDSDDGKDAHHPEAYERVLHLLREVVRTNQWPSTSIARSNVIIGDNLSRNDRHRYAKEEENDAKPGGSFTVVSDAEFETQNIELPMGNSLFPELGTAVFDLERSLSTKGYDGENDDGAGDDENGDRRRPPSSHCAINCNAQFTPHVDSGRGAGQSLSMIVGLGNYDGGELMVEGTPHDIRYEPLEFDGWKLRHWTRPFAGERFSLVWFTPEGMVQRKE